MRQFYGWRSTQASQLYPDDNISMRFLKDFNEIEFHPGAEPMFMICLEKEMRDSDNFQVLKENLEHLKEVQLSNIGIFLYSEASTLVADDLASKIKSKFGIKNFITSDLKSSATQLTTGLNKMLSNSEETMENQTYEEFKLEKVAINHLHYHSLMLFFHAADRRGV